MHYFLSFYFHSGKENPLRKQLKDEFMIRYPWITLVQGRGIGFIDYKLLNQFLSKINKNSLESITIIDSDLYLPDNFRDTVEENIKNYHILHNCKELIETRNGVELYRMRAMTYLTQGFTGSSWSFSKKFLEAINYSFPEEFTVGGLDYIFGLMFIRNYSLKYIVNVLGGNKKMIEKFYLASEPFFISFKNTGLTIKHEWHGERKDRLLPLEDYGKMTDELARYLMTIRESA